MQFEDLFENTQWIKSSLQMANVQYDLIKPHPRCHHITFNIRCWCALTCVKLVNFAKLLILFIMKAMLFW